MEKELTKCFDISIREKRSLLVTITHSGREEARQLETSKVGVFSVYWCCWHTVWKMRKFALTSSTINFVKASFSLIVSWFDEIFFNVWAFFCIFPHCVVERLELNFWEPYLLPKLKNVSKLAPTSEITTVLLLKIICSKNIIVKNLNHFTIGLMNQYPPYFSNSSPPPAPYATLQKHSHIKGQLHIKLHLRRKKSTPKSFPSFGYKNKILEIDK